MQCLLSPDFWVYLICMIGFIMIIRLVVPWFVSFFGFPEPVVSVIMIILWVVIACLGVYFLFGLLSCMFSGGGIGLPAFPHGR